jgi:lathosterol oxidase
MDVALRLADEYALDRAWAWAFPAGSLSANVATSAPTVKDSLSALGLSIARLGHRGPEAFPTLFTSPTSPLASLQDASIFPRDSVVRQLTSLFWVAYAGSFLLYWSISTLAYYFLFDRRLEHHPRFLKNQVRKEIALSMKAMPGMAALIVPWFVGEVRGTTLLYDTLDEYGTGWFKGTALEGYGHYAYLAFSMVTFMAFTDYCIYWIHRWLHIPFFYKRLHKPHHRWLGESAELKPSLGHRLYSTLLSADAILSFGFQPVRRICAVSSLPVRRST